MFRIRYYSKLINSKRKFKDICYYRHCNSFNFANYGNLKCIDNCSSSFSSSSSYASLLDDKINYPCSLNTNIGGIYTSLECFRFSILNFTYSVDNIKFQLHEFKLTTVIILNEGCNLNPFLYATSVTEHGKTKIIKPPPKDDSQLKPRGMTPENVDKQPDKEDVKKKKKKSKDSMKKLPLRTKIKNEVLHFFHGFKLLFINTYISIRLVSRVLRGHSLRRREKALLRRTVGDIFRLIPFSVIVLIPFMELSLPILLKLFPGMLPTTFQSESAEKTKMKNQLKVKLEMAKFLQDTLEDISKTDHPHCEECQKKTVEFSKFFQKVRSGQGHATKEEIKQFSRLFNDSITLASLSRPQIVALCRILEIQPFGTTAMLRFQLEMKLRNLAADDKLIRKEGVNSLTYKELQEACKMRGMRALGFTLQQLRDQLEDWLDLSIDSQIPPSLLLLSRVFILQESMPPQSSVHAQLSQTISALPETVANKAKQTIDLSSGKWDRKSELDIIKNEFKMIKKERLEEKQERKLGIKSSSKFDDNNVQHPYIKPKPIQRCGLLLCERHEDSKEEKLSPADARKLKVAVDTLVDVPLVLEKEEITELKEKLDAYKHELAEYRKFLKGKMSTPLVATRLHKQMNKMTDQMNDLVSDLQKNQATLKEALHREESASATMRSEILRIDALINTVRKLEQVPCEAQIKLISGILTKLVNNKGAIRIDLMQKLIDFINRENLQLDKNQIDEVIELLKKEDTLALQNQLDKSLKMPDHQIDTTPLKEVKPTDGTIKENNEKKNISVNNKQNDSKEKSTKK